jgi:hypothetical protein
MKQKQTSLSRNRHRDFIRDFNAGATFESFLGEKDLDVTEKLTLFRSRESSKEANITLDDREPRIREASGAEALTTSFLEQSENHVRM